MPKLKINFHGESWTVKKFECTEYDLNARTKYRILQFGGFAIQFTKIQRKSAIAATHLL